MRNVVLYMSMSQLTEKPPVGANLDIRYGFSVIVTDAKSVAGGGVVAAERIDEEVPAQT